MSTIAKIALAPLALLAPGAPRPVAPPPAINRNMAAEAARRSDLYRTRRGAGSNELTRGGAEARTPGGKVLLGQ